MKIAVLDIRGTSIKAGIYENGSLRGLQGICYGCVPGRGKRYEGKAIGILKGCCGFERIGTQ